MTMKTPGLAPGVFVSAGHKWFEETEKPPGWPGGL